MSAGNKGSMIAAVLVTLVVAGAGGFMIGQRTGQKSAGLEGQVVATVDGTEITKLDVYNRLEPTYGASVVKDLIDEALVDQAAQKANVTVTQAEVDQEMAKIMERMGGEEQFNSTLAMYGIDVQSYRDYTERLLKATKILSPGITVEEAELQDFFNKNLAAYDKRQVHARHILVSDQAKAQEIKAQLDQGADFATLAKENSIEPAAAETGGDLGTFGRGKMDATFDEVVFNLPVNQISEPFQTSFGWHVAQVLEVTGEAPTFESVRDTVEHDLIQQKVSEKIPTWLEELRANAKINNTLEETAAG